MNAGITSERIYDALKTRLLGGDVLPGERIEPGTYAELLGSSVTPVRDALHRLAGEHIVEMRPAEGFQLPLVTEPGLRDLIMWSGELLRLALRRWPAGLPAEPEERAARDHPDALRMLFGMIAARSGQSELTRQIEAASDRLASARMAECRIAPDAEAELAEISAAVAAGDARSIGQQVIAHHRRSVSRVPVIVEALYRRD